MGNRCILCTETDEHKFVTQIGQLLCYQTSSNIELTCPAGYMWDIQDLLSTKGTICTACPAGFGVKIVDAGSIYSPRCYTQSMGTCSAYNIYIYIYNIHNNIHNIHL